MSLHDLYQDLIEWNYIFFFYQDGLTGAIEAVLSTFKHPVFVDVTEGFKIHPVFNDIDGYMSSLERCNALPKNPGDMLDMLKLAISTIDQAVYQALVTTLGDIVFEVTGVTPISDRHDYAITISIS